jgi:predicted amidohydrolase
LLKGKRTLVLMGMAERVRDDVYNAAPLISAKGVIGTARKLYLVNLRAKTSGRIYAESIPFKAGERIAIFDTEFGRIGVLICLDNRHPEIAHAQAIAGCWLKLRPAAIPFRPNQENVNSVDLARASENQTCDCTINLVGQQGDSWYRGGSAVIFGSRGLASQSSVGRKAVEEVLEYEVTEEEVYAARGNWHNAREARPDLLKQLWEIGNNYKSGTNP